LNSRGSIPGFELFECLTASATVPGRLDAADATQIVFEAVRRRIWRSVRFLSSMALPQPPESACIVIGLARMARPRFNLSIRAVPDQIASRDDSRSV
jgi:hypothetical protein